ncbi:sulfotransferase family 2 domain-containing protein [Sagittula salina]|uniref:Sulfotransferase family 2 domain-containing protein n=1 Tax=Sagittula salina TaxID=2820268 RepID=A0A940MSX9_9RHOB|nr:sulfotransferase family 2 domain-containing protein [Sagittula salina]MBP0484462.1 sulfotransferase family 2 domain-containing protein [Sagittula salina]
MIYPELQCIFVHIPKTGGTSVENALVEMDGTVTVHAHDHRSLWAIDPRRPITSWLAPPSRTLPYLREAARLTRSGKPGPRVSPEDYAHFLKVAFVRNPWSRAVSWYRNVLRDPRHRARHGVTPKTGFSEFLAQHAGRGMLKPQTFWLTDRRGTPGVDVIGRFESLGEDFAGLAARFGRSTALPHLLHGRTEDFRRYYTDSDAALVGRVYAAEIKRFGYDFDG